MSACAHCGKEATMLCSSCQDVPEYMPGDAPGAVYCNRECQKAHWPIHKAQCIILRRRKVVLRAAKTLKAVLIVYRETVFDMELTKVEFQDDTLFIHQKMRDIEDRAKRGPFPSDATNNVDHKEAVLLNSQCTMAVSLLCPLTRKLLSEVASTLQVADLDMGKPLLNVKFVPSPMIAVPHTVVAVRFPGLNEQWIIDVTGAQYGFKEVLMPFWKYLGVHGCQQLGESWDYDLSAEWDIDNISNIECLTRSQAQRDDLELERKIRKHFYAFVDEKIDRDLLKGTDYQFQVKLTVAIEDLRAHMLSLEF
ncbi:hypothetical protein CEP54_011274 [Fusarium duplospermum]|uniref:MYND-type domain-containing protein n=1 Tax=Fusarium duplospermum TaxID=1325734 RepID=A0A428PFC4_9HYPO|nr:hypothetical protein CEP54_011274 [Fusarium duplospermum]